MGVSSLPVAAPAQTDLERLRQSALRKNAWRMLPILTLAFVFNYIDRTSVGFAGTEYEVQDGLVEVPDEAEAALRAHGYRRPAETPAARPAPQPKPR